MDKKYVIERGREMKALDDLKNYMRSRGWTEGGGPGSVKTDSSGAIIARHLDPDWTDDVRRACDILSRRRSISLVS